MQKTTHPWEAHIPVTPADPASTGLNFQCSYILKLSYLSIISEWLFRCKNYLRIIRNVFAGISDTHANKFSPSRF